MEMRKFIVEIKPDGQVYAVEYTDPAPIISRQMASEAYRDLEEELHRYPYCFWSDEWKAAYCNGASSILAKLGIKF